MIAFLVTLYLFVALLHTVMIFKANKRTNWNERFYDFGVDELLVSLVWPVLLFFLFDEAPRQSKLKNVVGFYKESWYGKEESK